MISGAKISAYAQNASDKCKSELASALSAAIVVVRGMDNDPALSDLFEAIYENLEEMVGAIV